MKEAAGTLKELVGIISDGLRRTHELVGDMRNFSGVTRRGMAPVDVREGVYSTAALLKPTLSSRGIEVVIQEHGDSFIVLADSGALNQVFLNLLKNAADAMAVGGGEINVEIISSGTEVAVQVEDSGSGIDDEAMKKIFDPFFTTKPTGLGSGLGLPISRQIAEEYGGRIEITSEYGTGTTVSVRLPRADVIEDDENTSTKKSSDPS
jgi:two-component system NtrC family sensor kinase